jgi:hypothetical protein
MTEHERISAEVEDVKRIIARADTAAEKAILNGMVLLTLSANVVNRDQATKDLLAAEWVNLIETVLASVSVASRLDTLIRAAEKSRSEIESMAHSASIQDNLYQTITRVASGVLARKAEAAK